MLIKYLVSGGDDDDILKNVSKIAIKKFSRQCAKTIFVFFRFQQTKVMLLLKC